MDCNCGSQPILVKCSCCGTQKSTEASLLFLFVALKNEGWGLDDDGGLVCPSCIERVAKRLAMKANAPLN